MTTRAMLKKADFFMYTGFDCILMFICNLRTRGRINIRWGQAAAKIRFFELS